MSSRQREPQLLDSVVNVRLTLREKERLQEDAATASVTMSALIRARYFGRPLLAHADQVAIRELRRLGGLLKALHVESGGAYRDATESAIRDLQAAIRRLAAGDR